jgi:hypothetical protein
MAGIDMEAIHEKVLSLKHMAEDINGLSKEFPAVRRNIRRVMASIKMLEINTVDLRPDK